MITVRRVVECPADVVWELLINTERWPDWGFSVSGHRGPTRIDGTSTGHVRTILGFELPYEITAFEPTSYWRWTVGGIPATGHRVIPGPNRTARVEFDIPNWAFLYQPIVWWSLRALGREAESANAVSSSMNTPSKNHARKACAP